ncbi:kelch-like protein 10 [Haemaphysalis longicornis]
MSLMRAPLQIALLPSTFSDAIMKAAGDGVEEMSPCNDYSTATASAQQLFADGGRQSRFSAGAVARSMPMLRAQREVGRYCDVKFRTSDGGEFLAHRFVLAARFAGCGELFAEMYEAMDTGIGAEREQQVNDVKWPPFSEVLVSDMSAEMLELAIDLAYHVPLKELVGAHNVLRVLEVAEALSMSAVRNHCLKLLGESLEPGNCVATYQMAVSKGYKPLNEKAFRFLVRNFEEVWTTSPQFLSLAFEELWNVLHDDELHVTNEVQGSVGAILKWIAGEPEVRRGFLCRLLPLVRFLFGSRADMQRVEAEPLVREDEEALELLYAIRWTLDMVALDSEGWGFWPYLAEWRWLRPRIPKDILFVFGGWSGGATSKLLTYNCRSRRWVLHPDQCTPPSMGGFTGLDVLDTVEFYDPTSDSWTRVRSMSTPRSGLKAVVHGDDVYVMGGFDGAQRLNWAEKMDVRTGRWSELPSMVFPRSNFVAALLEGSIYVAGGFNGTTTASLVERYDIEARQWHRATDLSITCSAAAAFVYHDVPNARRWF